MFLKNYIKIREDFLLFSIILSFLKLKCPSVFSTQSFHSIFSVWHLLYSLKIQIKCHLSWEAFLICFWWRVYNRLWLISQIHSTPVFEQLAGKKSFYICKWLKKNKIKLTAHDRYIKLKWIKTDMLIHLCIVYGCFHPTVAHRPLSLTCSNRVWTGIKSRSCWHWVIKYLWQQSSQSERDLASWPHFKSGWGVL